QRPHLHGPTRPRAGAGGAVRTASRGGPAHARPRGESLEHADGIRAGLAEAGSGLSPTPAGGGRRTMNAPTTVLVIDDSAGSRRVLVEQLEAEGDLTVIGRAANGREGLER